MRTCKGGALTIVHDGPMHLRNPLAEGGNGHPYATKRELSASWIHKLWIDYGDPDAKERRPLTHLFRGKAAYREMK